MKNIIKYFSILSVILLTLNVKAQFTGWCTVSIESTYTCTPDPVISARMTGIYWPYTKPTLYGDGITYTIMDENLNALYHIHKGSTDELANFHIKDFDPELNDKLYKVICTFSCHYFLNGVRYNTYLMSNIAEVFMDIKSLTASFNINGNTNTTMTICENSEIILNGASSSCEDKYLVSVQLSDKYWNRYGTELISDHDGSAPENYNVRSICNSSGFNLYPGNYYRIKLAVMRDDLWSDLTKLVYLLPYNLEVNVPVSGNIEYFAENEIILSDGFSYSSTLENNLVGQLTTCDNYVTNAGETGSDLEDLLCQDQSEGARYDNLLSEVERLSLFEYSIFPNPTNGKVNVDITNFKECKKIEIINQLGNVVAFSSQIGYHNQFDLSGFTSGIYIVYIYSERHVEVGKLILY